MSSSRRKSVLMIWPGVKRFDDPLTSVVKDRRRLPYLVWVSWFDNLTSSHAVWRHGLTCLCQTVLPLKTSIMIGSWLSSSSCVFLSNLGSPQGLLRYFVTSSPLLSYTSLVNFRQLSVLLSLVLPLSVSMYVCPTSLLQPFTLFFNLLC
jgi:hypothetical protein